MRKLPFDFDIFSASTRTWSLVYNSGSSFQMAAWLSNFHSSLSNGRGSVANTSNPAPFNPLLLLSFNASSKASCSSTLGPRPTLINTEPYFALHVLSFSSRSFSFSAQQYPAYAASQPCSGVEEDSTPPLHLLLWVYVESYVLEPPPTSMAWSTRTPGYGDIYEFDTSMPRTIELRMNHIAM